MIAKVKNGKQTDNGTKEVVRMLRAYMGENGISQARIARRIGLSPAVVSLFLKNKYKGDCLSVTNKVVGLISQARREDAKRHIDEVRSKWFALCYLRSSARRIIGLHDQLEIVMEGVGVAGDCANRTAELEQQIVEELSRMEQAVKIAKRKM